MAHRLLVWVLGGPGSGKGTQCRLAASVLPFQHLDVGSALRRRVERAKREELSPPAAPRAASEDGAIVAALRQGRVLPARVTLSVIGDDLQRGDDARGLLVDGFPRTLENRAEFQRHYKRDCDLVLFFDCAEEELRRRLRRRAAGSASRPDDRRGTTVDARLRVFREDTMPVLECYRQSGLLKRIDASLPVMEVHSRTVELLQQLHDDRAQRS